MSLQTRGKKRVRRQVVSARYPVPRVRLVDRVARKWGKDRAEVLEAALDRLLVAEGLLEDAA